MRRSFKVGEVLAWLDMVSELREQARERMHRTEPVDARMVWYYGGKVDALEEVAAILRALLN